MRGAAFFSAVCITSVLGGGARGSTGLTASSSVLLPCSLLGGEIHRDSSHCV